MPEKKEHKEIDELIARHLAGVATAQEEAALQGWLASDSRHHDELEEMRRIWQESENIRDLAHPDLDREWEMMRDRLYHRTVTPSTLKVVHRKKSVTRMLRIAAILVIGLFAAVLVRMVTGPLTHKVYTATAATEVVHLPDGSVIHLDRGSSLVTPRRFRKDAREVSLTGVAFFEVSHDAARPFTVHAGAVDITVLGTKFNVRAEKKETETLVDLVEGSVQVTTTGEGKLLLNPGEEACWDKKHGELTKTTIPDPNFLAWKTHQFTFRATPLQEVLSSLGRAYHVHFIPANKHTLDCRVTASFEGDPLKDVLTTLSTILDLSFEERKDGYVVEGRGCRE